MQGLGAPDGMAHLLTEERFAARGQLDMACLALEQGKSEPGFEQFDLIAHRRLGHAEGFTGAGEIAQTGRGFEDADGVDRWKLGRSIH